MSGPRLRRNTDAMQRVLRKQTLDDFNRRLVSVERSYHRRVPHFRRRDRAGERPVFWTTLSFAWTYLMVYVATNRGTVELAMDGSTLPRSVHDPMMAGLAAGMGISVVFLVYHILRGLFRARRYYNSGSILIGFVAACALHLTPASAYDRAYRMLGDDTRSQVAQAVDKVRDVEWQSIISVSSQGDGLTLTFD